MECFLTGFKFDTEAAPFQRAFAKLHVLEEEMQLPKVVQTWDFCRQGEDRGRQSILNSMQCNGGDKDSRQDFQNDIGAGMVEAQAEAVEGQS